MKKVKKEKMNNGDLPFKYKSLSHVLNCQKARSQVKTHQYLRLKDQNLYLLDSVRVMVYGEFYPGIGANKAFHDVGFNSRNIAWLELMGPEQSYRRAKMELKGNAIILSHWSSFNFNRALREHFQKKFKIHRFSGITYEQDVNVLPIQLRHRLSSEGYDIPKIREIGYELFFKFLRELRSEISNALRKQAGVTEIESRMLKVSLMVVEICYDVVGPTRKELARKSEVFHSFRKAMPKWTGLSGGEKNRQTLSGIYHDSSIEKLYFKSASKDGSINRIERYFGKRALTNILRKRTFRSREEFLEIVGYLAKVTFDGWLKIYCNDHTVLTFEQEQILNDVLDEHFRHNANLVRAELSEKGCIHTGGSSASAYRPVARKTRELAAEGKVFVQRSPGVYVINWSSVLRIGDALSRRGGAPPS